MAATGHRDGEVNKPIELREGVNMKQPLGQETTFDKLANLPFAEGRPTKEAAQILRDELLFQRATQTYLWAMPLINTLGMQVGSKKRSAPATTSCPSGSSGSAPRLS
jgi:hypothetical protein